MGLRSQLRACGRAGLGLAAVASLAGCVQFGFWRFRDNEPIEDDVLATIRPGETSFGDCLTRLGAPQIVFESLDGDVVIAYAWQDEISWGLSVDYSFTEFAQASLSWDLANRQIPGVVLIFDQQLELLYVKRGFLRDMLGVPPDEDPALRALRDNPG